jgi:hypothetical protein
MILVLENVPMSQTTTVVQHHVPGRLRLRIPGTKANPRKLEVIRQSLIQMPGVHHVVTNARLGSAVVQYDSTLFPRFIGLITEYAAEHSLFTITRDESHPCVSQTNRSINHFASELNQAVHAALGGTINLKELLPLVMGAYGLFFVDKGQAAAQWINWIQVALDTYIDLHEDDPVADLKESVNLLGAQMLARQAQMMEMMRTELEEMRQEIRAIRIEPHS